MRSCGKLTVLTTLELWLTTTYGFAWRGGFLRDYVQGWAREMRACMTGWRVGCLGWDGSAGGEWGVRLVLQE